MNETVSMNFPANIGIIGSYLEFWFRNTTVAKTHPKQIFYRLVKASLDGQINNRLSICGMKLL